MDLHFKKYPDTSIVSDPGGSGFKLSVEVKSSYKNPLFKQIFNDFPLFLKNDTYQIKVPCFIKCLLDWLKTKIKYLLN